MNIKSKIYLFITTTSLIAAVNLNAVVVTWENGTAWTNDVTNDVRTDGTLFEARNYGSSSNQIVNGVSFTGVSHGEFTNSFNGALGTALPIAQYNNLLNTAAYNPTSSADIIFTGLTIGDDYLVQLWYADTRGGIPPRSSTITSDQGGPDEAFGSFAKTQFIVGTFTADSNNISLNLRINGGNLGAHLNAAQLRAVPETETYALIFGGLSLGMVLMMRRRRSKNLN